MKEMPDCIALVARMTLRHDGCQPPVILQTDDDHHFTVSDNSRVPGAAFVLTNKYV